MPCDSYITEQVRREREAALVELEEGIASGRLRVVTNSRGEVGVVGWAQTTAAASGWCEGCALARIARSGGMVARAKLGKLGIKPGKQFVAASHNGHPHRVK